MLLGTVSSISSTGDAAVSITSDGDTADMPVDCWSPANRPAVGDRVLYDVVGGLLIVLENITRPYRVLTGSVTFTPSALNTHYFADVTYPTGFFTAAPYVMIDTITTLPEQIVAAISGPSSTTVRINFMKTAGTTGTGTVIIWTATQT